MRTKFFEIIEVRSTIRNLGPKIFLEKRILIQKIFYFIMEFSARTFNFPEPEN